MDASIAHLVIYQKIKEHSNGSSYIAYADLRDLLNRWLLRFSTPLKFAFIKEMETLGLVRKVSQRIYQITGGDMEKEINKFISPLWDNHS